MYLQHFGLLRAPFEMTPDPAFLYLGESHQEGLATLVYGVRARKGFVMLTGEVGTGQDDAAARAALAARSEHAGRVRLQPAARPLDFFRVLFDEFGIETPCTTKAEFLIAFNKFLIERLERDHPTLLIVDEAQNLSAEMLEEIRLLSNLETPHVEADPDHAGRAARARGDAGSSRSCDSSASASCCASGCDPSTPTRPSTTCRSGCASRATPGKGIFKRGALRRLHAVTAGIPRLINVVCDGALLLGYSRGQASVDASEIDEVARDLGLVARERRTSASNAADAAPRKGRWRSRLRSIFR